MVILPWNTRSMEIARCCRFQTLAIVECFVIVSGWVRGTTLFIEMFWIEEAFRGQEFGSNLLRQIEDEGRRLGAVQTYVDTFSFQAPQFYEKQGYAEFGRLPHAIGLHDRIWLMKKL